MTCVLKGIILNNGVLELMIMRNLMEGNHYIVKIVNIMKKEMKTWTDIYVKTHKKELEDVRRICLFYHRNDDRPYSWCSYYGSSSSSWKRQKGDRMTNKEAAEFIWDVLDGTKSFNEKGGRGLEALELAIKALKNEKTKESELIKAYTKGFDTGVETVKDEMTQNLIDKVNVNVGLAQPIKNERPQGEWIFHKDYNESCRYGCNQCGNLNNIPSNFCPNCGAGMKFVMKKEKVGSDKLSDEEAKARYICCPMCDRKTCNRRAEDCDVVLYFKNERGDAE